MKPPKILIIFLSIYFPIFLTYFLLILTGKACISYEGFAIDSNDNIYVGKDAKIDVYNPNGEWIREINTITTRGYRFTIQDDQILLDASTHLLTFDLNGNLISKKEISESVLSTLGRRRFVTESGVVYTMENRFFRTSIFRNEGDQKIEVYKMPMLDFIVRIMFFGSIISGFIVIPIIIVKWRKG